MSTNAGCASTQSAQLALATNDSGDVATVSPLPIPVAQSDACSATVPFANATGVLGAGDRAQRGLEPLDRRVLA